jgi:hypothetical protein
MSKKDEVVTLIDALLVDPDLRDATIDELTMMIDSQEKTIRDQSYKLKTEEQGKTLTCRQRRKA